MLPNILICPHFIPKLSTRAVGNNTSPAHDPFSISKSEPVIVAEGWVRKGIL